MKIRVYQLLRGDVVIDEVVCQYDTDEVFLSGDSHLFAGEVYHLPAWAKARGLHVLRHDLSYDPAVREVTRIDVEQIV